MERVEISQGLNCAQAIVYTCGQEYGVASGHLLKITPGFSGGCETGTCGALLGAVVVLGLKYVFVQKYTYLLMNMAKDKFGGTSCYEISTNEDGKIIQLKNLFQTICPHVIEQTILFLRACLENHIRACSH